MPPDPCQFGADYPDSPWTYSISNLSFFTEAFSVADAFIGLHFLLSSLGVAWFSVPGERVWTFAWCFTTLL